MSKAAKEDWRIDPETAAMVVIDMQQTFVDAPHACLGAKEIVPRINRMAEACRKANIPVVFVNQRSDLIDAGLMDEMRPPRGGAANGTPEWRAAFEFCEGINVGPKDFVIPKCRYSAFVPGSSVLEPLLRSMKRDTIIICGVATDICVGTTTAVGMMLGFRMFMAGDATATFSEERQKVALQSDLSSAQCLGFGIWLQCRSLQFKRIFAVAVEVLIAAETAHCPQSGDAVLLLVPVAIFDVHAQYLADDE
jgi:ureidoacrylate peracid hydrolase